MKICAMLLAMAAGILLGTTQLQAAAISEGGAAQTNPMQLDGVKATPAPFDFAASPLSETSKVQFVPASQSTRVANTDPSQRALQTENGPVVIPLPPAAWTGALGLIVLIGWLALRRRRQSC